MIIGLPPKTLDEGRGSALDKVGDTGGGRLREDDGILLVQHGKGREIPAIARKGGNTGQDLYDLIMIGNQTGVLIAEVEPSADTLDDVKSAAIAEDQLGQRIKEFRFAQAQRIAVEYGAVRSDAVLEPVVIRQTAVRKTLIHVSAHPISLDVEI